MADEKFFLRCPTCSRVNRHRQPPSISSSDNGKEYDSEKIDSSGSLEKRDEDLASHLEKGRPSPTQTSDQHDTNLVDWDGDNDSENPLHWPLRRKLWMSAMASITTFVVSFASSVFSTCTKVTAVEFGVGEEVMILGVSLYVLGFACGPLIFGPISELYGRSRPLIFGFLCFAIFQIPLAVARNLETIFLSRFLAAAFGAASIATSPGILVDIWEPYPRGIATLLWASTVFAGPTVGPIVGEYVVKDERLGWRWTAWLTLILAAVTLIICAPTASETFAPVLLQRKAARLRYETKNWALHSKRDEEPITLKYLTKKYATKPIQMLVREPILAAVTAFMSVVYGIIYLTFVAYPYAFSDVRGWPTGISSLPFIGLFVGYMLGLLLSILESSLRFRKLQAKGPVAPEERLPPMIFGAFVTLIGLFWFAWTSSPHITWVPQVLASIPIGCGIFQVFMTGQVYLMDIYTVNANSALAGNAFCRAAVACAFPLVGGPMYRKLGVEWGTSLLGFLCAALLPFPVLFYMYGKKVRSWSRFAVDGV